MDGGRAWRHLGATVMTVGVLSTAGMVVLTSCTGDTPRPGPTTTTAPSATPESTAPAPTATPPAEPKATPTPKSAEAFVKYFWDVHNYSYATFDLTLFNAISDPKCTFCTSTADDIETMRRAGTHTEGAFIQLTATAAPPIKIKKGVVVAVILSQDPGRVVRSDGTIRNVPSMTKRQAYVSLNWTGIQWFVDDVAIDKTEKSP